jgi:hypothetical protein
MKLVFTFSILLVLLLSCNNAKDLGNKEKAIELTELKTNYDVKVGDKMTYSLSIHGSVGYQATVSVADAAITSQNETTFAYTDKSRSKMSGGDGGTRTYTFEAKFVGSTIILIEKEFRGDITDSYELTINVTE